jgi:hypothetical protein
LCSSAHQVHTFPRTGVFGKDVNGVPGAAGGKFTVAAVAEIITLWP